MGNQLVAVGQTGSVITSPDGIFWTGYSSGTSNTLNSVAWLGTSAGSGTKLVAVGTPATIMTSP
jgi:hypothetical protein